MAGKKVAYGSNDVIIVGNSMTAPLDQLDNPYESDLPHEKANSHHHRSPADGMDLRQAIESIAGSGTALYFGPERKSARFATAAIERKNLSQEQIVTSPLGKPDFTGGEHEVWLVGNPPSSVFKQTLDGAYGMTLDEENLLDPRIFQTRRKLTLRAALPSEYLLRWCVLKDVFQLPTTFQGQVQTKGSDPNLAVSQPYIPQDENDQPLVEDIDRFMKAYGFTKVDPNLIAISEIAHVTWYRQSDGILITDAFPRNFRKDSDTQALMPIDLVVTLVPQGGSKVLGSPKAPWSSPTNCG